MKSKLYCEDCNKETVHYKKDAGPWFYKVCEPCGKETLLLDDVWEEFANNRIRD